MVFIEDQPTIPTIDLSPFLSPSSPQSSRDAVITAVRSACQSYGFFQLTGHGIPLSLQRSILHCAELLFALPLAEKQAMAMSKSMGMSKRGYEAVGGQTLDVKPDTKEGFYIGVEVPADDPTAGTFLKGPNLWPASLRAEDFRTPVMEYHRRVLGLHELLLRILAAGLSEQGKELMEGFMQDAVANIKLLHYPPNAKEGAEEQSVGGTSSPSPPIPKFPFFSVAGHVAEC
jgi:isopenicillin N synthase-like dioxygenase